MVFLLLGRPVGEILRPQPGRCLSETRKIAKGSVAIGMKHDPKRLFAFETQS